MKITTKHLLWAGVHPLKTLRYLKHRDNIPYDMIAEYLPSSPTILEAGAADGKNTAEMADYWPQSFIHAFEPVPDALLLVEDATKQISNRVKLYPYALGSASAHVQMNVSGTGGADGTQSSSLLNPTGHLEEFEDIPFTRKIDVEVVRLDDWALRENVEKLDFLWLDLQGYELEALRGAERLLDNVSAMHVEVSNQRLYDGGVLYPELKAWLRQRGFRPVINATFRRGGNVLFAR